MLAIKNKSLLILCLSAKQLLEILLAHEIQKALKSRSLNTHTHTYTHIPHTIPLPQPQSAPTKLPPDIWMLGINYSLFLKCFLFWGHLGGSVGWVSGFRSWSHAPWVWALYSTLCYHRRARFGSSVSLSLPLPCSYSLSLSVSQK